MHILYIQQLLILPDTSGNDRCYKFAQIWRKEGHRVTFLASGASLSPEKQRNWLKKPINQVHYEGIELILIKTSYSHHMKFSRRILSFLDFFFKALFTIPSLPQFDIIIAYSAPLSVGELGRKLARKLNIPFVFEVADVWPDVPIGMGLIKNPMLMKWLIKKTQKIYQESAAIFTFSEGMKSQITSHQIPPHKVFVLHNGADIENISYQQREHTHDTKKFIKVLYLGTIGVANDLTQLIEIAHIFESRKITHIQFTIIGSGNDEQRVKRLWNQYQLTNINWHNTVPRNTIDMYLNQADIGIVCFASYPVLQANSATKFFDYLANGLPVVINYQGWQAEYLKKYQCGLSSPQGDIKRFADNVKWLSEHSNKRLEMGKNARKLAKSQFDRAKIALETLGQLTHITSSKCYQ